MGKCNRNEAKCIRNGGKVETQLIFHNLCLEYCRRESRIWPKKRRRKYASSPRGIKPHLTTCHMHFVQGQPWLIKVACVVIPWSKRAAHTPSLNMMRAPFALSALLLLSAMLPSLMYSVRDRGKTTEFLAQIVLFFYALACVLSALLTEASMRDYACLYAQLMLMHLYASCFVALQRDATLALYPQAFKGVYLCGVCAVFATYGAYTPHVSLQVMHTLGALFSAELIGLGVLLVSSVMRGVANMYEEGLACYA